jgi:hypothetical protein
MNFFTHIMMSDVLYRRLARKMFLDRKAFLYGNIKPDLSPQCLRNPHILDNYLFIVHHDSNRLISEKSSEKEFSADLGVICHYICDFFCYCHLDHTLYHRFFFHFIYEIRLHVAMCSLLMKNEIRLKRGEKKHESNLASMVVEMRKEYMTKQKTLRRDIEYALLTSILACETILRLSQSPSEQAEAFRLRLS